MRKIMVMLLAASVNVSHAGLPDSYFTVGGEVGFFSYHRPSNTVVFDEFGSFSGLDGSRRYTAANYQVNLAKKKVIRMFRGRELMDGCFSGRLFRHPDGNVLASQNNSRKMLSLLDLGSGDCREMTYSYAITKL